MNAETSCGVYSESSTFVFQSVPMCLLTEIMVLSWLVTACRFAVTPTMRSPPSLANATTDGVVLAPSAFAITTASPFSIVATQELVVPRSIPITFFLAIFSLPLTSEFKISGFLHRLRHHRRLQGLRLHPMRLEHDRLQHHHRCLQT